MYEVYKPCAFYKWCGQLPVKAANAFDFRYEGTTRFMLRLSVVQEGGHVENNIKNTRRCRDSPTPGL
jgi:hypothetical protein